MKDTTTTIDELDEIIMGLQEYRIGVDVTKDEFYTFFSELGKVKQALLRWHKDKARSYVPEKGTPTKDLDNQMLYQLQGYNEAIDQTLKAIEESK